MTHLKAHNVDSTIGTALRSAGVVASHSQSRTRSTPPPQADFPCPLTFGAEPPKGSRTLKVILAVVITLAVGGG